MKRAFAALGALVTILFADRVHADEVEKCVEATVEGQRLQRAGNLRAARDRFATCSRASCPPDVVSRCEKWAQGVVELIPSIVVVARDEMGRDLPDVRVRIDGEAPAAISARAIELDPGKHVIVFERNGAAPIREEIVLHEAEKNRPVTARFVDPTKSRPPPPKPIEEHRPIPTRAWIAVGVSGVALATFGVFATKGAIDRAEFNCDTGCPTPKKEEVDTQLLVADIALGVAVVAAGIATWMILTRPSVPKAQLTGLRW